MVRAHIIYGGIVQGVGFRYTTQRYAVAQRLFGWVKNLPDGRVEMIVEGQKSNVEEFIQQIEAHFSGSIRNKDISFQAPVEHFKDFRILT